MTIAHRITLWVLTASAGVLIPMAFFSYWAMLSVLYQQFALIKPFFQQHIEENVLQQIRTIETLTRFVAYEISTERFREPGELDELFTRCFRENEAVYGMTVALTTELGREGAWRFRRDPADSDAAGVWTNLLEPENTPHYTRSDWYAVPHQTRKPSWSKPHQEPQSGIFLITYSIPLTDGTGRFIGVLACDVAIDWIHTFIQKIKLPRTDVNQLFLIDRDGTVLADNHWGMLHRNIFTTAAERGDQSLAAIAREMVSGKNAETFYHSPDSKDSGRIAFMPIESHDAESPLKWSLGIFIPMEVIRWNAFRVGGTQALIGLIGMLLLIFAVRTVARGISLPIRQLQESTLAIASGNLETEIPKIHGKDEIAALADSFGKMQNELKSYIVSLAETTRAKEQMESELRIGRKIQMSLLPARIPQTPLRDRFDLASFIEPAKQVGGDFYDYFLLDEDNLCVVMADVSGKGVPAALLMAKSSTLFRSSLINGRQLKTALEQLNRETCQDNDACMFITLFVMSIHLPTGRCRYVNAGHNPPFLVRHGERPRLFDFASCLPPGVEEATVYDEVSLQLRDGDLFFLYTDGVTEAFDSHSKPFGEKRTAESLSGVHKNPCGEIIEKLRTDITVFTEKMPQSDDITMLALRWFENPSSHRSGNG